MTKAIYRKKTCCHNLFIIITVVMIMMIFFQIYIPTAPSPPLPASNLSPPTPLLPRIHSSFVHSLRKRAVFPGTTTKHCITSCKKTTGIYHHISAGLNAQ